LPAALEDGLTGGSGASSGSPDVLGDGSVECDGPVGRVWLGRERGRIGCELAPDPGNPLNCREPDEGACH
jgi:hypothetical protein